MKKISLVLFLLFKLMSSNAQLEFSKWFFGFAPDGINFATNPPSLIPNSSGAFFGGGCSSICDNNGNLLFYTNGMIAYNSNHAIMANGNNIGGNNISNQSAQIVKQPGNNNNYYVFTTHSDLLGGYRYAVVDMSLAAGLGSVTVKNVLLYDSSCQKQVAIRHCNGKDVWMLSQKNFTNKFSAYLLTENGLAPNPVISNVGFVMSATNGINGGGTLKVSPDGKKIAMATYAATSYTPSHAAGGFQLFDFDAATGIVSNSLNLLSKTEGLSVEFSPDGTKLYGTIGTYSVSSLHQWNVCAANNNAILASHYSITVNNDASYLQWAIDGKIYITTYNQANLHVINSPNNAGAAMSFSPNAFNLGNVSQIGLPNYINTYTKPSPFAYSQTLACNYARFSVPSVPTFTSGCSSTPYAPSGYFWDFGDVASGSANTSTLANPSHFYSAVGTYTASLILINKCANDTLKKVIQVTAIGPNPVVTGNMNICKGERHVYTVSGGNTYTWSGTNATGTTQALTTNLTTQYTVSASANGCTLAKTFTVNINNCTGIDEQSDSDAGWLLYPNPTQGLLYLNLNEQTNETHIKIRVLNSLGALVQTQELELKSNTATLQTNTLPDGIYTLLIDGGNDNTVSKRFVVNR